MKTKTIQILSAIFFLVVTTGHKLAFGQSGSSSTSTRYNWYSMMQDPNVNFYEAQDAFYSYWAGRTDYKGNGYKMFKRWEYINESRVLPNGKLQAPGYVLNEYRRYMKEIDGTRSASGNWSLIGPSAYPVNATAQPTGMGRINAIAFHPTNADIIFIGSPSGGFWKTTDSGSNWINLSSDLPSLGVSSILVDPDDPDIIYLGTGDRDADDAPGIGVFKSYDGGLSWNQMNSTMGNVTVGAMVMHPSDPDIILAATSGGIYKTTDGGSTWSYRFGSANVKDIKFKPGDPTVVYAASASSSGARFYRSSDTGDGWTQITSGIPGGGTSAAGARFVIGVSADNPGYVYLVQITQYYSTFAAMLLSTDSGLNFSTQSTSPNIMDYACDGSGTASQATYDLCITVDPTNADVVYVGGINQWKSTDGGATWNISSHWIGSSFGETCAASMHADQHALEWSPLTGRLFAGHDGGICWTADGGTTWTEISDGLEISQVYKIGQSTSSVHLIIFGMQDNGTAVYDGETVTTVGGGDGMECLYDYSDSDYSYKSGPFGSIGRSGGSGYYTIASDGVNGINESGAWVTPYTLDNSDANTMFIGYRNVWRSNNVKASPSSSVSWETISSGESVTCKVIEQSKADADVLYVVRSGSLQRTDNATATAASVTWTSCALPGSSTPTDLESHPTNASTIYATVGYGVNKSTDKGASWTDITGNLPALFTNCLVYDDNSNEGLYVGNQTAVWFKDASMTDWVLFSEGLPAVDVRELEIFHDPVGTQDRISAGTYGRGVWQSDLIETGVINPADFSATAVSINQIDLEWILNASSDDVLLAWNSSSVFGTPVNGNSYSTGNTIPGGGTVLYNGSATSFDHVSLSVNTQYFYKIWSYDGSTEYSGGTTANATTTESIADFSVDNTTSCSGSLTVTFTDNSTAPYNSWAWDVDYDGVVDYTTQNPSHTYDAPGIYSVKLTISNGDASTTKENLILVMNAEPTVNTGCELTSNSNAGNGYGIGIYRFAIADIDYPTSNSDGYYHNYTCIEWTGLELNTLYDVTIQTGITNPEGAVVYIDYDDNGVFAAGEQILSFPSNTAGTRTLSFTTPSSGVEFNKGLRLRVLSKFSGIPSNACDIGSYGQAEDYTVFFAEDATWTGDVSAVWNTSGNWSTGSVPGDQANVTIPSGLSTYPEISTTASCKNLSVENGAVLTVTPGNALTVNGMLVNLAGNSGLILESDATGAATLIHATPDIPATVERYVAKYNDISDQMYHFISSPVEAQAIQPGFVTDPPTAGYDFMSWDEPGYQWVNSKTANDLWNNEFEDVFIVGKGYLVAWPLNVTKSFTGDLNAFPSSSPLVVNCTNTNSSGWNLIGNPFPSSIDWGLVTKGDGMDDALYYYDNENENYKYYVQFGGYGIGGGSRYIPPMQGFMVHAKTTGTRTLSFDNSQRTHQSSDIYYKSEIPNMLALKLQNGEKSDETVIFFQDGATEGFDSQADAYKLFSSAMDVPQVYSLTPSETRLAINTLPGFAGNPQIPVGIRIPGAGNYRFQASGVESFGPEIEIVLHDLHLGVNHDLRVNSVYDFQSDVSGQVTNRFVLQFKGETGIAEETYDIRVFWQDGYIRIFLPVETNGLVKVTNMLGQDVLVKKMQLNGETAIPLDRPAPGAYVVRITGNNRILTGKFVIN